MTEFDNAELQEACKEMIRLLKTEIELANGETRPAFRIVCDDLPTAQAFHEQIDKIERIVEK